MSVIEFVTAGHRAASLRTSRRLALSAGFGALAALALPPIGAVPVLLLAFPGLIELIAGTGSAWASFWVGWFFGLGHHLIGLYWVSYALFTDIAQYWWALPLSVAGLPVLMALFSGMAALAFRLLRPAGCARPVVFAGCWAASEWVRGHLFTGFPWNLTGYAWTDVTPVLQTAALVGIYGLSFITVLVASLPSTLADPAVTKRRAWRAIALGAALLSGLGMWGAWRLSGDDGAVVPGVRLRLVQPAIDQRLKWAAGQRNANFMAHINLSTEPADGPPPTHVIWAETAVPFILEREPRLLSIIGAATPPGGVTITGVPRMGAFPDGRRKYTNGLIAVDATGSVVAAYDKVHLVPFGEYVPLRRYMPFGTIDPNGAEYTPGPGLATLDLPGLPPVSPLICYEAIFPADVVAPGSRPRWLLNLTNDAWYGHSAGPYQHFAIARVRAVEEGLPLVRVANTGISGIVDAYGRVRAEIALGETGKVDADLPVVLSEDTPFSKTGNSPYLALVLSAIAFGLFARHKGSF